jgi:pyridoxine 4-dehydrogenase
LRQDWLGTQHLPVHDEVVATAVLAAAREAGVTWLDTADVYGPRAGDVERFLATRRSGFRVATKVGLRRAEGRWVPDGKASAIDRAIDASLERLGAIELLWLHAVDPRVELAATGRALARALRDGRVPAVGVCNVSVAQLRAFADLFPVAAVQVELSRRERAVVRSGVVEEARERGLPVLGYRPFQGRERSGRALADPVVARVAARREASPAAVVLAWLRDLGVVPLPGTTDPLHMRDLTTRVVLDETDRAELDADTELGAQLRRPRSARVPPPGGRRVVLVGGTPGAGKTRHTSGYADWVRLNRDTEGGTLEGLLPRLSAALDSGRDVVLDNTYATRAQRNAVLETSWRHGARVA